MTRLPLTAFAAMALAALPLTAVAHHDGEIVERGAIRVSHAHTEAPAAAAHSFDVYLTVENSGDTPDTLTAASVGFAAPGAFQANVVTADGTLTVREVTGVAVAAGQTVTMQPGSLHIVFHDVQRELAPGDLFELTLTFEAAGTLTVVGEVEHEDHDDEDAPQS